MQERSSPKSALRTCRCIIIGDEDEAQKIRRFLSAYPFFDVVRCANPHEGGTDFSGEKKKLLSIVDASPINEIIVGESIVLDHETRDVLVRCREQGIAVTPFPLLYENLARRTPVDFIGERWQHLVYLDNTEGHRIYSVFKRVFDITGATVGLVGFGLLFPFIALAIKLDSPGPLFYRQVRIGKGGRPLRIRKLRTMIADAEQDEDLWSNHNDPRVTRVGRWLRKTRLDEATQCWSILKGEMSIVGPRPERLNVIEKLEKEFPFYRLRHIAKPGLAGWAMVNRGYMCSFEDAKERLEYDLYYVKHRSLRFDALIFFRAFWHLITMKGI